MSKHLSISDHLFSNEWNNGENLSDSNLRLSQSLQMLCSEATSGSAIVGMSMASLASVFMRTKSLSLCSRFLGESNFAKNFSHYFSIGTGLVTEGYSFHLAPEFLRSGTVSTLNLAAGGASSTLTVAFSKVAGRGPQGFLLQQLSQDLAMISAQEVSGYLGWSERVQGSFSERWVGARITACQMQAGAGLLRLSCHEVGLVEARLNLSQRSHESLLSKVSFSRSGLGEMSNRIQERFLPQSANGADARIAFQRANEQAQEQTKKSQIMMMASREEGSSSRALFGRMASRVKGAVPTTAGLRKRGVNLASSSVTLAFQVAQKLGIARFTPMDPNFPQIQIEPIPPPLSTVLDGLMFADSLGLTQRSDFRFHKICQELQTTPDTLETYQAFEASRAVFRYGLQEKFDPILKHLAPLLDKLEAHVRDSLNPTNEEYQQKVEELLGSRERNTTAELLMHLYSVEEVQPSHLRRIFSEEDLSWKGYEPKSIEWTIRHPHVFRPGMIESVLDSNIEFEQGAGGERLRKAAAEFDATYDQRMEGGTKEEASVNQKFKELQAAFKEFFQDPFMAKLWLTQNALHASVRKLLFRNEGNVLQEMLPTCLPSEDVDFARRATRFLEASIRCREISERMQKNKQGVVDYLASLVGTRDYHELQIAQGELEEASVDLLTYHTNPLIRPTLRWVKGKYAYLSTEEGSPFDDLRMARVEVTRSMRKWSEILEKGFTPEFTSAMRRFWEYYDEGMGGYREKGVRIGLQRYEELLSTQVRPHISDEAYQQITLQWEAIKGDLEKEITSYKKAIPILLKGRLVQPRDVNRRIEAMAKTVMRAHDFVVQNAARYKVDLRSISHFLPMFESYAAAKDEARWQSLFPYARPLFTGMLRFIAGQRNGYSIENVRLETVKFITEVANRIAPQTFYIDPNIKSIAQYMEGLIITGNHSNHFEVLDAVLSGYLYNGATAEPLAKYDLSIPGIDLALKKVSIPVRNSLWGILMPQAQASEVAATGSPIRKRFRPGAAVVYDQRTMGIADDPGVLGARESAPTHEILPNTEASFDMAEGASVLSGLPTLFASLQTPGTVRMRPNQHVKYDLKRFPSSVVLRILPFSGMPQEASTRGRLHNPGPELMRTLGIMDGNDARFDAEFAAYSTPRKTSRSFRQIISQISMGVKMLFSDSHPWYPASDQEMVVVPPDSRNAVPSTVNRLAEARLHLENATFRGVSKKEIREVENALKRKETLTAHIWTLELEGKVGEKTFQEWQLLRTKLEEQPDSSDRLQLISQMESLLERVKAFDDPLSPTVNPIPASYKLAVEQMLKSRLNRLLIASAREAIGEPLSPAEKLLIDKLSTSFSEIDPIDHPYDRVVRRLHQRSPLVEADLEAMIQEEKAYQQTKKVVHLSKLFSIFSRKVVPAVVSDSQEKTEKSQAVKVVPESKQTIESKLKSDLMNARIAYAEFISTFNQRRKDSSTPESQMLHISEMAGFEEVQTSYHRAIEEFFFWINVTPSRWKGKIFPELLFKREGDTLLIEPANWKPGEELSVGKLWSFLLNDTIGSAQIARRLHEMGFDQKTASDLYLMLHGAWGERSLTRIQGRLRIEGAKNLISVAGGPAVIAPTHDSALEFPLIPRVLGDYGFRVFIMADKKFFTSFPHPPSFGLIRALLGPMDEYGHIMVDRSDVRSALASMTNAGLRMPETGDSILIFPQGTRRRSVGKGLQRREDPVTYGAKAGLAKVVEVSRAPVIPIGMINGARIFPAQAGQAFIREGVLLGQEYRMNIGAPLRYENIVAGDPHPTGTLFRNGLVQLLNQEIGSLTGREVGPPAESKDKRNKKRKG